MVKILNPPSPRTPPATASDVLVSEHEVGLRVQSAGSGVCFLTWTFVACCYRKE